MFQVTNTHTFQSWTADSRDELLAELELANAKRLPLAPSESYDIVRVDDNGQILETARVNFPLEGTIDAVLEHFGYETKPVRKPGLLKRLWPGFRKKDNGSVVTPAIDEAPSHQDGMRNLLAMTQQADDEVVNTTLPPESVSQDDVPVERSSSSEDQDQSISTEGDEVVTTTLPPEPAPHEDVPVNRSRVSEGQNNSASTEGDEVVTTTLPPEPVSHDDVSEEAPVPIEVPVSSVLTADAEVVTTTLPTIPPEHSVQELPPKAEPRGLESLSTYDLQLEFVGRVRTEVGHIDQAILELEAQIDQLKEKRGSHLKLLETINTLQLT